MAISNPESLNFGLSAIRLRRNNQLVGQDSLVGNVTAEWNTGIVNTMAAASSYPSYYRNGGTEGGGTISLQDRPVWIDGDVAGGEVTITAASSTAVVSAVTSTTGTSLNATDVTITTPGTVANHYDFLLEATGSAVLKVSYVSDRGEQVFENVAISDTATAIGDTGVSIAGPSSPSYTMGDRASFSVEAPHAGKTHIEIPQFRTGRYYELTIWGAEGGADDTPQKIVMPRVYIVGANFAATAKEMPAVEIPFNLCAPLDGSSAVQRTLWQPTS